MLLPKLPISDYYWGKCLGFQLACFMSAGGIIPGAKEPGLHTSQKIPTPKTINLLKKLPHVI